MRVSTQCLCVYINVIQIKSLYERRDCWKGSKLYLKKTFLYLLRSTISTDAVSSTRICVTLCNKTFKNETISLYTC